MKINRRQAIIGAASLGIPFGMIKPKPLRATEMGWATRINGSTVIKKDAPGFRMNSNKGTLIVCCRSQASGILFQAGMPSPNTTDDHMIWLNASPGEMALSISGNYDVNTHLTDNAYIVADFEDMGYNTAMFCWDTSSLFWDTRVNGGTPAKRTGLQGTNTLDVNYQNRPMQLGRGELSYDTQYWTGDIAYLYLSIGTAWDLDSIVDNVYDVERGYAVRPASDGSNIIPGIMPDAWFYGPPNHILGFGPWTWPGNATPNSATIIGTLENSLLPDAFEPGSPI